MSDKPKSPYPSILRKILKRIFPPAFYRRHIGRHELFSMFLWESLARQLKPEDTVLDIGAFHGEYALLARKANVDVKIFAFEPNPANFAMLEEKVAAQNITIEACAVGEQDGESSFLLNAATSRLIDSQSHMQADSFVKVPVIALDSWIELKHISPALIKIDTEGFETPILRGAQSILTGRIPPPVILCEILSTQAGQDVMKVLPEGYMYFHIDENRGVSQRAAVTRKHWRNKNWLFIPSNKVDLIKGLLK